MKDEVTKYLKSKPGSKKEYPFNKTTAVYKTHGKMFALMTDDKEPPRISLKCDPELGRTLREQYESVQPGYHLNKTHWITIVLTGQLTIGEIKDLINHSYQLVCKNK